ncbi:MAG: glycosyltransferase family 9 protein [Melioribacteraceae bacterium]|nr:glycosyltransferase family 9 protein [Melioribacteraceae bacterium]
MRTPKNILIVRTDRIGDVILTLPIAGIIKKKYPESKITFMIKEYTSELVKVNSFIDDIIVFDNYNFKGLLKELRTKNFDTAITVYPRFEIALLLFLAGIKLRVGTGYRWYSFLFNRKTYDHRKTGERHELEYNVRLLKHIDIEYTPKRGSVDFNFIVDKASRKYIDDLLSKNNFNSKKKIIIIHPGSKGSAVDLPIEKFNRIINVLSAQVNIQIILTGSKEETETCNSLTKRGVINLAGKLTLMQLAALIDSSHILIANSTGPIHIAAALNKNIVGFYPKIASMSPTRWGPFSAKAKFYQPKLDCNNCTRKQCEELNCMNSIEVEEVTNYILSLVKEN